MLSDYAYNTIKYMGCDPDAITCFLSTYEREILKDNVQPNSVLHVEIIIMKENKKETKFNNNTVCISSFSIYWKQRA